MSDKTDGTYVINARQQYIPDEMYMIVKLIDILLHQLQLKIHKLYGDPADVPVDDCRNFDIMIRHIDNHAVPQKTNKDHIYKRWTSVRKKSGRVVVGGAVVRKVKSTLGGVGTSSSLSPEGNL